MRKLVNIRMNIFTPFGCLSRQQFFLSCTALIIFLKFIDVINWYLNNYLVSDERVIRFFSKHKIIGYSYGLYLEFFTYFFSYILVFFAINRARDAGISIKFAALSSFLVIFMSSLRTILDFFFGWSVVARNHLGQVTLHTYPDTISFFANDSFVYYFWGNIVFILFIFIIIVGFYPSKKRNK